jgi:hypothetical protein
MATEPASRRDVHRPLFDETDEELPRGYGLLPLAGGPGPGNRVGQRGVIPGLRANSRQSAVYEARSLTRCTLTPIWQLPILPSVPEYCRATHGEAVPSQGKPVSSAASASTG